jgi:hypothetical protein
MSEGFVGFSRNSEGHAQLRMARLRGWCDESVCVEMVYQDLESTKGPRTGTDRMKTQTIVMISRVCLTILTPILQKCRSKDALSA